MPAPQVALVCERCGKPFTRRKDNIKRSRKLTGEDLCRSCTQKLAYSSGRKKVSHECGGGWAGWFKGMYFSSLLEMSYIKQCMERAIPIVRTHEKVGYIDPDGKRRTYFPDFFVEGKIVEIKPSDLVHTELNKCKHLAARKKWKKNFIIVTEKSIDSVTDDVLMWLHLNGDLVFTDRYELKFQERQKNECTIRRTRQLRQGNTDRTAAESSC